MHLTRTGLGDVCYQSPAKKCTSELFEEHGAKTWHGNFLTAIPQINMGTTNNGCNNGLSHLVEAATALTALIEPPKAAVVSSKNTVRSSDTVVTDDDEYRQSDGSTKSRRREIFPQKLMEILADDTLSDIISWLPHGRSFAIVRPDFFTIKVLPKYLPSIDSRSSTKYPSFTRKLNRW